MNSEALIFAATVFSLIGDLFRVIPEFERLIA